MPSPASFFALAALFAAAAAAASAHASDPIHACVAKANGKIRIVAFAGDCKASETALAWSPAQARLELVGFTTATVPGGAGIFEWTRACSAQFPGANLHALRELVTDST